MLFRSHYGFDAFYCQPGIDGAHEKGGVEGEVGWFRRNHLTPMPEVATLDELNDKIRAWEHDDNTRRITGHANTIGQDYHAELPHLAPLSADDFDPGLILHPRVDRSALITVRMVKYSVPAHLIGQRVRVSLRASCVVVFEGRTVVATHPRLGTRGVTRVELDHYLEVLRHKPGAFPGSTALAQARAAGAFTAAHDAFWAAARKTSGDVAGTQALIDVLLLHRSCQVSCLMEGNPVPKGTLASCLSPIPRRSANAQSGSHSRPAKTPRLAMARSRVSRSSLISFPRRSGSGCGMQRSTRACVPAPPLMMRPASRTSNARTGNCAARTRS